MAARRDWSREELLMAMNLYCRLPFGRLHKGNPQIIELATAIGRTPSSLAMKLVNFASLDPVQRQRGVAGLSKTSAGDRQVWNEFHADWSQAFDESQQLLDATIVPRTVADDSAASPSEADILASAPGNTQSRRETTVRTAQWFFRKTVLASYTDRCCISGIAAKPLLVASHIVPWSISPQLRLNPCNGLCLSKLHDTAFDQGLITFDEQLRLVLSKRLRDHVANATMTAAFIKHEGQSLQLPNRFHPDPSLLARHRETTFVG